jgi:hypothetical protein
MARSAVPFWVLAIRNLYERCIALFWLLFILALKGGVAQHDVVTTGSLYLAVTYSPVSGSDVPNFTSCKEEEK